MNPVWLDFIVILSEFDESRLNVCLVCLGLKLVRCVAKFAIFRGRFVGLD